MHIFDITSIYALVSMLKSQMFVGAIVQVDEKRRQADLARQQYEQMMKEQR